MLRVLVFVSACVFVAVVVWAVLVLDSVERILSSQNRNPIREGAIFHFVAIVPAMERDLFYLRAVNGMKDAAEEDRAAVQVFEYQSGEGPEAILKILGLVADVSPDGVVLSIPSGASYDAAVAAITERGVPVVTLETDLPSSKRRAHIGTNAFELGKLAHLAVAERFPKGARVALLLDMETGAKTNQDATFVMGFNQAAKGSSAIEPGLIRSAQGKSAAGEEFIREILSTRTDIDVVVFTNARDAEGAAQALIEFGRVGTLSLIAFDDTPEIRKLMESGVVAATLARNPDRAGADAIQALVALARNERTSAYIDPGVSLLRSEEMSKRHSP